MMYFSDLITYLQKPNSLIPIIYLFFAIILILAGFYLDNKITLSKYKMEKYKKKYDLRMKYLNRNNLNVISLINFVAILGIIASLLFTYEMIFIKHINIMNAAQTREIFSTSEATGFSKIASILAFGSLISLSSVIILWKDINFKHKCIWIISPCLFILFSILSSGRQAAFQIIVVIIAAIAIKKNNATISGEINKKGKKTLKYKILICLIISLIMTYGLLLSNSRNDGNISTDKTQVLQYYFKYKLNPVAETMLNTLPDPLRAGVTEMIVYYTHEIPEFAMFWDIPQTTHFYGMYSTPFIARRLYSIGLNKYSVEYIMNYVSSYMESIGVMPAGWKTVFSFFIVDFGKIFTLIISFIIGIVSSKIYKAYKIRRSFFSSLLLIITNVSMIYTIMFPAASDTTLLFTWIFSIIMFICESLNKKWYLRI
ncbi:hypothetical protein [Clostridium sp. Ade.TY]|uniref:hypothetical protein n=1 Tax=Clostridium sp. Ade.TY TaxID=1391647 RepID=UPI0012680C67|nr:hypothetical protein [Clostridium sp. Ade.TY]